VRAFETRLRSSLEAALTEAGRFFMGEGDLRDALRRLAAELDRIGVPYAVVGAMALGGHGFVRMTEAVDVLVDRDGLERFRAELVGRGYVPTHAGAFRDVQHGVRVEFVVTGEFPGDGRPKPVAFPDPRDVAVVVEDGVRMVALVPLLELKLASGVSAPHRLRDLSDVQDLIRSRQLPPDLASELDPSVREKYVELWRSLQGAPDPDRRGRVLFGRERTTWRAA
jgi:hypothetical protein